MNTTAPEWIAQLRFLTVECPIRIDWLSAQHREGDRKSPFKGNGRDYCDFRDYQPGDNVKRINWRMLARRPERPVVTLFEEERNACIAVIADVGKTMDMVSVGLSKRELATVLTASIVRSAARTNDSALFVGYNEQGVTRCLTRRSAHALTGMAPAAVHGEDTSGERFSAGGPGLAGALKRLPTGRSLVFVITDLAGGLAEQELEALRHLGIRHEIVFLLVSDLRERELPDDGLLPWLPIPGLYTTVDDSGATSTIWTTKRARQAHTKRFADREDGLFARLAGVNCKFASLHTEDDHNTRRMQLTRILSGSRIGHNLNLQKGDQP